MSPTRGGRVDLAAQEVRRVSAYFEPVPDPGGSLRHRLLELNLGGSSSRPSSSETETLVDSERALGDCEKTLWAILGDVKRFTSRILRACCEHLLGRFQQRLSVEGRGLRVQDTPRLAQPQLSVS